MKLFISTLFLINILLISSVAYSQCDYFDDFSSPGDWTQVGSLVEVSGGALQYLDGAPDAVQRRVYKELDNPYTSDDCWEMTLEFLPEDVGTHSNGQPFTGHMIFSLTETDQDPIHDCPDDDCTGYPPGTQDIIGVSYSALNPPDGDLFYRIRVRNGTTQYLSDYISYSELGSLIYVELKKSCSHLELNIYSDEEKQNPLGNGPVSLDIPDLSDLNYIQHSNHSGGWYLRELTGTIDNVCIERFDYCSETFGEETYLGCEGDGYSVEVNGNIYDEDNPNGIEVLTNSVGCDSTVTIDLVYQPNSTGEELYIGCEGDGYSVEVNGTTYDENNPTGTEILDNSVGCDSTVTINLIYNPPTYGEETYEGCEGDGYSVEVNGTTYDESNPTGTETLVNSIGCDSIVAINLVYNPPSYGDETYDGCTGDGYYVIINGTTYDESNPTGTETLTSSAGCDSIVTIDLVYKDKLDIYTAGPLEECDYDFDGEATFDLSVLDNDITGGNSGQTTNWYEDMGCNTVISNPSAYTAYTSTVYVFLTDNTGDYCNSDTIPIDLTVIDIPNPGEDNQIDICNTETCVDFYTSLAGTVDYGGVWTDDDQSGADITSPDCVDFSGIDQGIYHYTYTIQDTDQKCDPVSSVLIVDVSTPGNPGQDGDDTFCGSPEYLIDLESYLGGDYDKNGSWYSPDGIDVSNPNAVDLSGEDEGNYFFYYSIDNYPCDIQEAVVVISIIDEPFAGIDNSITICNSGIYTIADLENTLSNPDNGGFWTDVNNSGVDLSDPAFVDFYDIAADTFLFVYTIPENNTCYADSAIVTVIVESPPFAGVDGAKSLCLGSNDTLFLFTYLTQVGDSTGYWNRIDSNNFMVLPSDTVILNNPTEGIDSFAYVTSGYCDNDTAFVFIEITSSPYAGDDYIYSICKNSTVSLFDSLTNYNLGGIWLNENFDTVLNPNEVYLENPVGYKFYYVLPENGSCIGDTAIAIINSIDSPEAGNGEGFSVCEKSPNFINLLDHISGYSSSSGIWVDNNGNVITNYSTYDFSAFDTGQYIIMYIMPGNSFCPNDTATLDINVVSSPNAGIDNSFTACNSDVNSFVNLENLLGNHDSTGYWINIDNLNIDMSNPLNVNFSGINAGIYRFEYKIDANETCEADSAIISIEIKNKLSAGQNKELTFCEGGNTMVNIISELSPSPNTLYVIEDPDMTGVININTGTVNVSSLSIGTYVYSLITGTQDLCGTDTAFMTITIVEAFKAGEDNIIEVCNDETDINLDTLLGNHDEGGIWIDIDNSGIDIQSTQGKSVTFENANSGIFHYEYKIESSGTCPESSAIITVIVDPVTYFDINEEVCPGQKITVGNNVYDLDNPSGTEILTNVYGCDSIISINLTEKITDATVLTEDENCFGYGKFIVQSSENTTLPIILDLHDIGSYNITSFPFIIDSLPNGNYIYDIIDNDGCIIYSDETFTIEGFEPYSIDINILLENNTYQLNIETDIVPAIIHWEPTEGLSCDNCLNPVANPEKDTEYFVEITDDEGCTISDTVFLEGIIIENKDTIIDIPNIFTPNNDQSNDIFYVKSNITEFSYEMYIYDRWGENLFYAKDLQVNNSNMGWDGTFKGKTINPGVYVYMIIIYSGNDKKEYYTGDVLLIK